MPAITIQLFKFINFVCSCQCTFNASTIFSPFFSLLPPTINAAGHRSFIVRLSICVYLSFYGIVDRRLGGVRQKGNTWHRRWPRRQRGRIAGALAICLVHQKANNRNQFLIAGFVCIFHLTHFRCCANTL